MISPSAVGAAVLAGAAAAGCWSAPASLPGSPRRPPARWVVAALALPTAGLAAVALDLHQCVLAAITVGVGAGLVRIVRRRRGAKDAEARADRVLAVCEGMASDLGAGQPPLTSLERAGADWPELSPVAVAARMGADVPAALRELAGRPGARQLRTLAATWQVAHETGSGLAAALATAAEAIRADRRTARLVASELAAAHATARMLAVLPLGVLLLGLGVGGDPLGFLLGTTPGLVLLAVGLGLSFAGLTWLERIADRVLGR